MIEDREKTENVIEGALYSRHSAETLGLILEHRYGIVITETDLSAILHDMKRRALVDNNRYGWISTSAPGHLTEMAGFVGLLVAFFTLYGYWWMA